MDLLVLEDSGLVKLGASAAKDMLESFVHRHETPFRSGSATNRSRELEPGQSYEFV